MRETPWIEWTRTRLQPQESEDLRRELTSAQKARLLEHDYVWVEGIGVLWNPPAGNLRRARFTHGTHFETKRGEFYIDRDGSARKLSNGRFDHGAPTARPPSLPATIDRYDGPIDKHERSGKSGGFDDAVPRPNADAVPTPDTSGGLGRAQNTNADQAPSKAIEGESQP